LAQRKVFVENNKRECKKAGHLANHCSQSIDNLFIRRADQDYDEKNKNNSTHNDGDN
jgi:hypothetical protein